MTKSVTILIDGCTFSLRVARVHDVADLTRLRVLVVHSDLYINLAHRPHGQLQIFRSRHELRAERMTCRVEDQQAWTAALLLSHIAVKCLEQRQQMGFLFRRIWNQRVLAADGVDRPEVIALIVESKHYEHTDHRL